MKGGELKLHKKWQATHITPLRPSTLAAFPPWGIRQELVVWDLPVQIYNLCVFWQVFS